MKTEKEIREEIWEEFKPKFKMCSGNHPSPYTDWKCLTCVENKGYNDASNIIQHLLLKEK